MIPFLLDYITYIKSSHILEIRTAAQLFCKCKLTEHDHLDFNTVKLNFT